MNYERDAAPLLTGFLLALCLTMDHFGMWIPSCLMAVAVGFNIHAAIFRNLSTHLLQNHLSVPKDGAPQ